MLNKIRGGFEAFDTKLQSVGSRICSYEQELEESKGPIIANAAVAILIPPVTWAFGLGIKEGVMVSMGATSIILSELFAELFEKKGLDFWKNNWAKRLGIVTAGAMVLAYVGDLLVSNSPEEALSGGVGYVVSYTSARLILGALFGRSDEEKPAGIED